MAIIAQCDKLPDVEVLQRSSRIVNTLVADASIKTYPATSDSPSACVGTAPATLNGKIYLLSGRGGTATTPIEESGTTWEYDRFKTSWSLTQPSKNSPETFPAARSYHCIINDGKETLYLHAGCPEKRRHGDLWAFCISRKEWTEFAPAFDPPRGGTSIAFVDGKLYRMNGFDGKTEHGGNVDIYTIETAFWVWHGYPTDGKDGPTPRSVSALLPISVGERPYLNTLFGEQDLSSLGH
ncbi:hypothetical protein N7466_011148 [Penicillium verhagenii]|uniref:uncharacterized protein n=1 Tax=Penicillium verhagenii TaxID=1562060 RepID=UPI002544F2D3|nr:uncharacterized protein N7466_011148 [Penicillium verhagenii]KAJ5917594.1 hypothetical protein N7466_011148 [Penicillium verhagenii]